MMNHIERIFRSHFSLPGWVIAWMWLFLIPANLSGFFFLETSSGRWIALLGGGALIINGLLVLLNGGFSRVLAIPHLLLWGLLEIVLLYRIMVDALAPTELRLILIVLAINGISLVFDLFDTRRWYLGERDVIGYEGMPVRI